MRLGILLGGMAENDPAGQPSAPKGTKPLPKCKAILLCEKVIIDSLSGQVSIISQIERFFLQPMPMMAPGQRPGQGVLVPGFLIPGFVVFLRLVDGIGRYDLVIEMHDLHTATVIGRGGGPGVEFGARLNSMCIGIPVPPTPTRHAGAYDIVVFANGEELERYRFEINPPLMEAPHDPESPTQPA